MNTKNITNNKDMKNISNGSISSNNLCSSSEIMKNRQAKERSYSESQVMTRQHVEIPISKYGEFKNKYNIKKEEIGRGMFSTVYYATDSNGNEYAMKRISVEKLDENRIDKFLLELYISQKMSHVNVVKCYEVFRTKSHWYIVSEYCCSGTFKHLIRRMRNIEDCIEKEITARYYLYQLRDAIQYLHENNIIHRDLKPDNILMTKNKGASSELIVKLSDFGFSRYFDVTDAILTTGYDDLVSTICGSPIYMAPELLVKMKYNMKADIWSFGVIMYEMLHGKNPFYMATNVPELRNIMQNNKIFETMGKFSPECIDLLQKILQTDPINRISWEDFFNHNWFSSTTIGMEYEEKISMNSNSTNDDQEEQQMFDLDEDLEKKKKHQILSKSVPIFNAKDDVKNFSLQIPKKKSEDDFIIIQPDDNCTISTNGEQQIKMYNETYTSSIIKILANSMVYVFGKNKNQNKQQYAQSI